MTRDSESELARELGRGSPEAVRAVRERVQRIVAFRGYRISAEDRKDLEQEVMAQIWQAVNRSGFDAGGGFWGFVEVVTARRCIDWLRTRKKETPLVPEIRDPGSGPLASTLAREHTRLAHAALAQLGKPCRDLIYLRVGLDKPYREVATILGRSEGALRVQLYRCIREARKILDGLGRASAPGHAGSDTA